MMFQKTTTAFACAGVLALALAGCSGGDTAGGTAGGSTAGSSSPAPTGSASVDPAGPGGAGSATTGTGGAQAGPPDIAEGQSVLPGAPVFCQEAVGLYTADELAGADPTVDPAGFVAALTVMSDQLQYIDGPPEIAAEWSEFQTSMSEFAKGAAGLNTSDPAEFISGLNDVSERVQPSAEAQQRISDYIAETCAG